MKKFIAAVLCAGLVAVSAAGCGYQDALTATTAPTEETGTQATADSAEETSSVTDTDYNESLDGLYNYFVALGHIGKDNTVTDMDAALIGAKQGKKYAVSNSITIELYEYDTNNLSSKANEIISSVKTGGEFTILDLSPVKAYLCDSGKFLMIYSDSSINDEKPDTSSDAYVNRQKVIDDFNSFRK